MGGLNIPDERGPVGKREREREGELEIERGRGERVSSLNMADGRGTVRKCTRAQYTLRGCMSRKGRRGAMGKVEGEGGREAGGLEAGRAGGSQADVGGGWPQLRGAGRI